MTPLLALIFIDEPSLVAFIPITLPFSSTKSVMAVSVHKSTLRSFRDKMSLAMPALPIVNLLSFHPHLRRIVKSKIYLVNNFANWVFQPGRAPNNSCPST